MIDATSSSAVGQRNQQRTDDRLAPVSIHFSYSLVITGLHVNVETAARAPYLAGHATTGIRPLALSRIGLGWSLVLGLGEDNVTVEPGLDACPIRFSRRTAVFELQTLTLMCPASAVLSKDLRNAGFRRHSVSFGHGAVVGTERRGESRWNQNPASCQSLAAQLPPIFAPATANTKARSAHRLVWYFSLASQTALRSSMIALGVV